MSGNRLDENTRTFDAIFARDALTARVFAFAVSHDLPELRRLQRHVAARGVEPLAGADGTRLLPGCARIATTYERPAVEARHTMVVAGELVAGASEHRKASPQVIDVARPAPTHIHGPLADPAAGQAAADALVDRGVTPLADTRLLPVGYLGERLDGASASLGNALAIIGAAIGRGIPADLVFSAELVRRNGRWELEPVGDMTEKLRDAPPGCRIVGAKLQPELAGRAEAKLTLDEVIALVWPGFDRLRGGAGRLPGGPVAGAGALRAAVVAITALLALLTVELYAQERWPAAQQPGGVRPGWSSPQTRQALLGTGLAALAVAAGAALLLTWTARRPTGSPLRFYGASAIVWALAGGAAWLLLRDTLAVELPRRALAGELLWPRSGSEQVAKSLLFVGVEAVLLGFPAVWALAWVGRLRADGRDLAAWWFPRWWRSPFAGPRFLVPGWRWSIAVAAAGLIALAGFQVLSFKLDPPRNDAARLAHMLLQAGGMIALAALSVGVAARAEQLARSPDPGIGNPAEPGRQRV